LTDPNVLVLACAASSFAVGLLAGVWLGFRVVSRDAALLATLDKRVGESLAYSSAAKSRADLLEAQWTDYLEDVERKRAKATAERSRAEKRAAPEEPAAPVDVATLSPRERRRLIARRVAGGSA